MVLMSAADGDGSRVDRSPSSSAEVQLVRVNKEAASREHRRTAGLLRVAVDHPAAVYVASLSTRVSRETMIYALRRAARFFSSTPAELDWCSLRFGHLSSLRAHLIETAAPSTGNRVLSAVRGVLHTAVKLGRMGHVEMLTACDVETIRGWREPRGRALSVEEISAMVRACDGRALVGDRDRALLAIVFGAGLRRAEAVSLNVGALDAGELRIIGKGNKERIVPVPSNVRRAVELWERARGAPSGAPLFVGFHHGVPSTDRLSGGGLYLAFEALAGRAGVARFSPHDLRRTYIGELFDLGVDIKTIQDLVGHSSPITTARYDRRPARTRRAAAERLVFPF